MAIARKAYYWLAVLGWAGLSAQSAQAHDDCCFPRLKAWHQAYQTRVAMDWMEQNNPWYLLYPVESAMTGSPQGNMYPTWPGPFSPPQPTWAQQQLTPTMNTGVAVHQGFPHIPSGQTSPWTAGPGQYPAYWPVSTSSTSVPSYWFAR